MQVDGPLDYLPPPSGCTRSKHDGTGSRDCRCRAITRNATRCCPRGAQGEYSTRTVHECETHRTRVPFWTLSSRPTTRNCPLILWSRLRTVSRLSDDIEKMTWATVASVYVDPTTQVRIIVDSQRMHDDKHANRVDRAEVLVYDSTRSDACHFGSSDLSR